MEGCEDSPRCAGCRVWGSGFEDAQGRLRRIREQSHTQLRSVLEGEFRALDSRQGRDMARGHDYLGLQIVYALPLQVGQAPFLPQEAHSVQLRLEPVGICEDRLLPPRVQPLTKMLQTCVGFNIDSSGSGMLSTR